MCDPFPDRAWKWRIIFRLWVTRQICIDNLIKTHMAPFKKWYRVSLVSRLAAIWIRSGKYLPNRKPVLSLLISESVCKTKTNEASVSSQRLDDQEILMIVHTLQDAPSREIVILFWMPNAPGMKTLRTFSWNPKGSTSILDRAHLVFGKFRDIRDDYMEKHTCSCTKKMEL